jgi:membrane fusion protein (multidrug efflux system)
MAARRLPIAVLLIAVLLVAAGFALFRSSPGAEAARSRDERLAGGDAAASSAAASAGPVVDGVRIESVPARLEIDLAVTLEAVRTVMIGAEVGGRVVELGAEENQRVAAGDVIVRLDPALSQASVARAHAAVLRARSAHALATTEHGRQQNLSGQGIASKAEFDRTQNQANTTDAQVAEAEAALLEAETSLAKTVISAPFDGVVSEFDVEPGAYLRVGEPVARLSDLSQMEAELGVDDRQILALEVGAPVAVRLDAYPGEWFAGEIHSLGRRPDPITRKFPVPVRIDNSAARLLPGMLGHARLVLGDERPALRLPKRVVFTEFEVDYLNVLAPDEPGIARVERRRVRVAPVPFRPDLLDVEAGLQSGELVAISAGGELRDGLRVRVREQDARWHVR